MTSLRPKKRKSALERRAAEIQREIAALKRFRQSRQRDLFIRQLIGEKSYLKRQLSRLSPLSKRQILRQERQRQQAANEQRSVKMKRSWDYFRAIQQNYYPDRSIKQLRSLFKKHKEGLETDVSEIAWRNPSP